jgi:hypothetical protein
MTSRFEYKWETARGAKIEATFDLEHRTTKTVYADGWNVEVPCSEWYRRVVDIKVNGKPTAMKELVDEYSKREGSFKAIMIGKVKKDRLLVKLPENVLKDLYGEEKAEKEAKHKKAMEAEARYEAHRKMMEKAMSY